MRHSNIGIQEGESRYSFTQYAAGGLFRWVDHGFRKETRYNQGWSKARFKEEETVAQRRWEEGIQLFSTLDELRHMDRAAMQPLVVP